jgi:hypothetical protein
MSLFRRHREPSDADTVSSVPSPAGLADLAAAEGWQAAAERPFDGHLEDAVHEIARVMYNAPRELLTKERLRVGETYFRDSYRTSIDQRTVIVANGWTNIQTEERFVPDHWRGVAVCAVELPSFLLLAGIYPRQFASVMRTRPIPTGDAEFDERFLIAASPDPPISQLVTEDVRRLIAARDDWAFPVERYLFGCVSKGAFQSADEVSARIREVLDIVAAFPESALPQRVDHATDDLIERISGLKSMEEAMAMLQNLTPEEREQLASSDSPLASFADVKSPQEAMARFKGLDQPTKMQLFAMFMRVKDSQGG